MAATARSLADLLEDGHQLVLTHGNGPQVGNILIQNEEAHFAVPPQPLDVCGAESQGMIGYMLQQALGSELARRGAARPIVTMVTQVVVDRNDPAFRHPTKPVGPFYTAERARTLARERGYPMREDAGRGWRRVVPSPQPREIVEMPAIRSLVESGALVIACGGGGIPVWRDPETGALEGVEAVIDKDLAAAVLGLGLGCDTLLILTDVPQVALRYGRPEQIAVPYLTVAEARRHLTAGEFPAGSMGPKVEAAVRFVEGGGRQAVIASLTEAKPALAGQAGTWVVRSLEDLPGALRPSQTLEAGA